MSEQQQGQQQQGNRQSFNSTAISFYNNQMSSVSFGFIDNSAYIAAYPVYEDQKGKQAQAGVKMYNRQDGVFIPLYLADILVLEEAIGKVLSGETTSVAYRVHGRNGVIRSIYFGKDCLEDVGLFLNLIETDAQGTATKDVFFEFGNEDAKKSYEVDIDWNETLVGTAIEKEDLETRTMMEFFKQAKLVLCKVGIHNLVGGNGAPTQPQNKASVPPIRKRPLGSSRTGSTGGKNEPAQPINDAGSVFGDDD